MIILNIFLRVLTLSILIVWLLFWNIQAKKSEKEKQKTKKADSHRYAQRLFVGIPYALICIQLLGVSFIPFEDNPLKFIGFFVFLIGIGLSVMSRLQLGANWTGAYDYQIKDDHRLITHGMYRFIRHPIYTSLLLIYTGAELVTQSYLAVLMFIYVFIWAYVQAKAEETLLHKTFGKEYSTYMMKTKMFTPYIF